ncbi:UPF0665 family protein [Zalerion maritima]|uniref:UPF0665 family protein n=1 Tax=Zalerion maritima TaxID=339359 RepID=A0AAD5RWD9_9PEZI|nr:UPF0665 family protein [Zalerion maritima]
MYYIRLLHGPRFEPPSHDQSSKKVVSLAIMVAICNDLGEQRLSPSEPVKMTVLVTSSAPGLPEIILKHQDNGSFCWGSNMWVRKTEPRFAVSEAKRLFADGRSVSVTVDVVDQFLAIKHARHLVPKQGEPPGKAIIFPVHSQCFWGAPGGTSEDHDVVRKLTLVDTVETPSAKALVFETADDIGDSIPSHVWDSGIAMAAFYADLCLRPPTESSQSGVFPAVKNLLKKCSLSVLELGAGVCSQGMGLASVLSAQAQVPKATIIMTDVDTAQKRAMANIERLKKSGALARRVVLEFEILDWEDGASGLFGHRAGSQAWDLILVSDCTYNYDTIPVLVQTFSALHKANLSHRPGLTSRILLSTKQRHDSETIFFDHIREAGWVTREQGVIPFPVAENAADEDMEVYLFEKQ